MRCKASAVVLPCLMVLFLLCNTNAHNLDNSSKPIHIHYMAPFLSGGGYSSEALAYLHALEAELSQSEFQWLSVSIEQHGDLGKMEVFQGLDYPTKELIRTFGQNFNASPDIVICHSEPGAWYPPLFQTKPCPPLWARGAFVIGRTMFETDRLPQGWAKRCNKMDEIWVPSNFHFEVFSKGGIKAEKIRVVPEPVDTHQFNPESVEALSEHEWIDVMLRNGARLLDLKACLASGERERAVLTRHKAQELLKSETTLENLTVFLSVFKWEARKAWEVLFDAYFEEFAHSAWKTKSTMLVIVTSNFHQDQLSREEQAEQISCQQRSRDESAARTMASHFKGTIDQQVAQYLHSRNLDGEHVDLDSFPNVVLFDGGFVSQEDLLSLYKSCSAVVIPSRGEGWGRPHSEAMAMGRPVIATNWSGNTQFMRDENSLLVPPEKLVKVGAGPFAHHRWAQPSIQNLKKWLRFVVEQRELAEDLGARARETMTQHYSIPEVGKAVTQEIRRIREQFLRESKPKHSVHTEL